VLRTALPAASVLLVLVALVLGGSGYDYSPLPGRLTKLPMPLPTMTSENVPLDSPAALSAENRRLEAAAAHLAPRNVYIVIDRANNRLRLMESDRILLDAACSAGSGSVLTDPEGGRRWIFDTPRGMFSVQTKLVNPMWRKPDWAFLEEGKPVPENDAERFEAGMLGEYALSFGDGYLIHGTLYERLLGRNVTHGCIRLGREDLRTVNRRCPIGTHVYIY
jgi:L,D-transpeptidase YbiS